MTSEPPITTLMSSIAGCPDRPQGSVDFVIQGNVVKFRQNAEMGEFLQSTGDTMIVEAAGRDVIWSIGLGATNPKAQGLQGPP